MKKIITIVAITLIAISMSSQNLSNVERRKFNMAVLKDLDVYEQETDFSERRYVRHFINLFNNEDLLIYNDLLGLSSKEKISVREYVDLLKEATGVSVKIKQVTKEGYEFDGSQWTLKVRLLKSLSYSDQRGALYSSEEYYHQDHEILLTFAWDGQESKIISVQGKNNSSNKRLEPNSPILQASTRMDSLLEEEGLRLRFNSFGQAFIADPHGIMSPDEDYDLKLINAASNNIFTTVYVPHRWRIKVKVNLPMGNYYNFSAKSGTTVDNSGIEFGVDLGYAVVSKPRVKIGAFAGAGFANSSIDLSRADASTFSYTTVDVDGDHYQRVYENVSGCAEKISYTDLFVPLYLDVETRCSSRLSLFGVLGMKAYWNLTARRNSVSDITYSVYGDYSSLYEGVIIDYWTETPFNGFSQGSRSPQTLKLDESYDVLPAKNTFSLDLTAGLGFRYKIYKKLFFNFEAGYQMGIINCYQVPELPENGENSVGLGSLPLMYDKNTNREHFYSPIYDVLEMKRQFLSLNVGIILKF